MSYLIAATEQRRQLALEPAKFDAALLYGRMSLAEGHGHAAALWLGAATTVYPFDLELLDLLRSLSAAYFSAGIFKRAAAILRHILIGRSEDASTWNDYGVALDRLHRFAASRAAFRQAIVLEPSSCTAVVNLADLAFRQKCLSDALMYARRAPADVGALATGGNACLRLGRQGAATAMFRRCVTAEPVAIVALSGLALAAMADENLPNAGFWLRCAAATKIDDVGTNNNLATWHLTRGDFRRGFELYEWRWQRPEAEVRRGDVAEWRGEPISGRSVLIYPEQGLGDAIQMVRYAPLLAARGARVVVESPIATFSLFSSLDGGIDIRRRGEIGGVDFQIAMMSLPRVFETTLDHLPAKVPYLSATKELPPELDRLLAVTGKRIGLVWQGNPNQVDEPDRSIQLSFLSRLLYRRDVTFFALQKEHGREQLADLPADAKLVDLGPYLDDFAVTASVISRLDLVIAPCTAVAHLAGALGRPTWILLKRGPDWRWMLDRDDSPWYPTARLFRQRRAGDWQDVVNRVEGTLASWTQ